MQVFFCLEVFVDDVKHRGMDDLKGVLLCFIELFFLFSYPFCSIRGHELPPREIFRLWSLCKVSEFRSH